MNTDPNKGICTHPDCSTDCHGDQAFMECPTCPGCGDELEPGAFVCSTKVCETCCSDGCDGRCNRMLEMLG